MEPAPREKKEEEAEREARSAIAVRNLLLVVLAFASGYIDALSYLGLGSVFTSNMTGNTVLLGLALGQGRGLAALRSGIALLGFITGVAVASAIVDRHVSRAIWPFTVTAALASEFLILVVFAAGGFLAGNTPDGFVLYLLIALSAVGMGIQSTAVRILGVSGVATTYITGTWTTFVGALISRLRLVASRGDEKGAVPSGGARLQAAVLLVYVVAAVAGGIAETAWVLRASFVPAVCVAFVVLVAMIRFPRN